MKKKVLMLLVACTFVVSMGGCKFKAKTTQSKTGTETSEAISLGRYFLYETVDKDEYLSFLENFDESKYEIEDISVTNIRCYSPDDYMNHYAITYKIAEEKWYDNIIK